MLGRDTFHPPVWDWRHCDASFSASPTSGCCAALLGTEVLLQVRDKVRDEVGKVFELSLCLPRAAGCLAGKRGMGAALDATYVLGRGAVKDTYKPQGESIVQRTRTLAVAAVSLPPWAEAQDGLQYLTSLTAVWLTSAPTPKRTFRPKCPETCP